MLGLPDVVESLATLGQFGEVKRGREFHRVVIIDVDAEIVVLLA
jgi:hypothetical protein